MRRFMSCLVLVGLFLVAKDALAACTVTNSHTLSATNWTDFKSCLTSAADDGTPAIITLSSGGVISMDSQAEINKHVHVVCSGTCTFKDDAFSGQQSSGPIDSTILFTESSQGSIEFGGSNFHWDASGDTSHASPSAVFYIQKGGGGYPVKLLGMTNDISNFFGGNFIIAPNRGLITGFDMIASVGENCQNGNAFLRIRDDTTSPANPWINPSTYGAADTNGDSTLYIEGNTIRRFNEMLDVKESGQVVFRFNTVTDSGIIHHGSDTEPWGARSSEIYGNRFIYSGAHICDANPPYNYVSESNPGGAIMNGQGFISIHGGTALVHNNNIDAFDTDGWWGGVKSSAVLLLNQLKRGDGMYGCWGTTNGSGYMGYPIPRQPGWGCTNAPCDSGSGSTQAGNTPVYMDIEPVYYFNNTGTDTSATTPSVQDAQYNDCTPPDTAADYIQADREYYAQNNSFDGTSGAGSGDLASRPSTCTAGVVYWRTNAPFDWDTTNVGSNDGALDKCTSTNVWNSGNDSVPFYVPCEYPWDGSCAVGGGSPPPATGNRGGVGRRRLR